jgi:tetratricopeptide (TPR) repeat protein
MQRPIFLSGKVMLEDGTPPVDQVVIEKVCNGQPVPQAYTDSKGRFQFQLGNNMAMLPDASVGSAADSSPFESGVGRGGLGGSQRGGFGGMQRGVSERDLIGCELRASLPGFRSDVIQLTGRRMMDNPDVGVIVLRRLAQVEGLTISATTALAPKDAKKAYEKGRESAKKGKLADAEKHFTKAVELYPKHAAAWFELGRIQEQEKNVAEARKSYAEALSADAKFVSPYLQLAGLAASENNWQEVLDTTDRVIRLNPVDFPQAFFYNAVANLQLKKLDAAEKSAREAVKLDPNHRMPKIEHVLGIILAQKNDFNAAAEHLQNYLKFAPKAGDADHVRGQLAEIDRLRGVSAVGQKQPE